MAMLSFGRNCDAQAFRAAGSDRAVQPERLVKQPQKIVRKRNVVNPEILRIKKVFIARQLALPEEQYNKFLHKYEEYQEDYNSIAALIEENKDDLNKRLTYIGQLYSVQNHYYEEFVKLMPPKKAARIFDLEKQFNLEAARISKEKKRSGDQ